MIIANLTNLGKLTQSCNPLVFSHPGISEWTIPDKNTKESKWKSVPWWTIPRPAVIHWRSPAWNYACSYQRHCCHHVQKHSFHFDNLVIFSSNYTILVYLQNATMSKKILVGEFTLQQVTYRFKPPDESIVFLFIFIRLTPENHQNMSWFCPREKQCNASTPLKLWGQWIDSFGQ